MTEQRDFKKLRDLLESVELFEDCISTRDGEEDEKEFKGYIEEMKKVINKLERESTLQRETDQKLIDCLHKSLE
jgi:hypothetical protein